MAALHLSGEWSMDGACFGLADTTDGAVIDYYDLLFDTVQEFISMHREELREYEAEDAELGEKLAGGNIDGDARKTLLESREKNAAQIGQLREFMNGSRILEAGVKFSREVLEDSEPDLTDRFNAAHIADKYTYLVNHYMKECRKDWKVHGSPSYIDVFQFGIENTREFFPKIAEQYENYKRERYAILLENDPVSLHDDLMVKYSVEYVADAGRRLSELRQEHDACQAGLRKHEATNPGWLKNVVTLGHAGKTWKGKWETMMREIAGCEREMEEKQLLLDDCKYGLFPKTVREHAKGEVLSRHPEVVTAREQHMARLWEQKNGERLEEQEVRQAERDGAVGKMLDDGLSRHM